MAARETAPHIALRDCSKETVGEAQYIRCWWRGNSVQSSTYFTKVFLLVMRSYCHHEAISWFSKYEEMQGLGSWNQFLKISNYLKTCPTSFPGTQSASLSTLNSPQGAEGGQLQQGRVQSLQRQMANAHVVVGQLLVKVLGKCQAEVDSIYYWSKP